jgi:ribosomal protein S27AE
MPEPCDHTPMLSEPTLTLFCSRCGSWLRESRMGRVLKAIALELATRGVHHCPRCGTEWVGDEDWCEECEAPTWAPVAWAPVEEP